MKEEELALHPTLLQERTTILDSKKEDPVAGDLMNLKVAGCHQLKRLGSPACTPTILPVTQVQRKRHPRFKNSCKINPNENQTQIYKSQL